MLEDLQAVLLDCLIEQGLHVDFQAGLLAGAPAQARPSIARLISEDQETQRYINARLRDALAILAEGRPGPQAYDPDRPAVRVVARPMVGVMA